MLIQEQKHENLLLWNDIVFGYFAFLSIKEFFIFFLNQESHVRGRGVISQTLFCGVMYREVQGYGSFVKTAKHRFLGDPAW